jgi:RimJ/RimL family protein N-acetyltransferase
LTRPPSFPIETPRLRIEPFRDEDDAEAHRLFCQPELWRFNDYGRPRTKAQTRQRLELYLQTQEEHGLSLWAVRDRRSGELVGDCGLMPLRWDGPQVEIGYRTTRERWGQGVASEAAAAVLNVGLGDLGLEVILGRAQRANVASWRTLEKLGMAYLGVVRWSGAPWRIYATGPRLSASGP